MIAKLMSQRKRYRLVIGSSENSLDHSLDRPYVATTAALIDDRLSKLGFQVLPGRVGAGKTPYIVGSEATKAAIKAAVDELADNTGPGDIGILYYAGHGTVTPTHRDLSVSVYDRPVDEDEGILVSNIIAQLTVKEWRANVEEIPRIVVIIETCYSGNSAVGPRVTLTEVNGLQFLGEVNSAIVVPPQMTLITATAAGDSSRAYDLKGTSLSAFGAFFERALNEDWECADGDSDGVVTVTEINDYIAGQLTKAGDTNLPGGPLILGAMNPLVRSADPHSFVAYNGDYYFRPGQRDQIRQLLVTPGEMVARVELPGGAAYSCPPDCNISFSAKPDEIIALTSVSPPPVLRSRPGSGVWGDVLSSVICFPGSHSACGSSASSSSGSGSSSSGADRVPVRTNIVIRDLLTKDQQIDGITLAVK